MANPLQKAADAVGIFGHSKPDLDCTTSMWLIARFLLDHWFPGRKPYYQFVPHHRLATLAEDPEDFPIIVDGGQVYDPTNHRFDTHGSVKLRSECAASLVARELDSDTRKQLRPLIESVRLADIGNPKNKRLPTPLPYFFRLLPNNRDVETTLLWHSILDKWYGHHIIEPQLVAKAVSESRRHGNIAVLPLRAPRNASQALFQKGYDYVVYRTETGIGVVAKKRLPYRFSQRLLAKLEEVGASGEFLEWFFKPDGQMACRGSQKSPITGDSRLAPEDLVEIIQDLEKDSQRLPRVAS